MELSVLIPTVGNREAMLFQVVAAVKAEHPDAEVLTIEGHSWGEGLNRLIERASGDYLSCCCDDTIPHEGWFEAGRAMLDEGAMPASRYFTVDGIPLRDVDDAPHGFEVGWCRSFLLTPQIYERVGPFIDTSWYVDFDYSERLTEAGIPVRACDGYSFTHLAGPRHWLTATEELRQRAAYEASRRRRGVPA